MHHSNVFTSFFWLPLSAQCLEAVGMRIRRLRGSGTVVLRCHYVRHYHQRHGSCTCAVSELLCRASCLQKDSACLRRSFTHSTEKISSSPDDDTSQTNPSLRHALQ